MKQHFLIILVALVMCSPSFANVGKNDPVILDMNKFKIWLSDFKQEAVKSGISQKTVDETLAGIKPVAKIIELDRKQPEFTMTLKEYLKSVVPASRVKKGREKLAANRSLIQEISKKYGVQERYIIALWGIETDFGERTGTYYIPEALATLAFDGRRSTFFRTELVNSLKIIDDGHITHKNMIGSWAGAMGQTQFMPSSFLSYAVDYDGDGKKDIWGTKADVFASIANYLKNVGWNNDLTWGRAVKLPKNFDKNLIKKDKKLNDWQALGVRNEDGSDLPSRDLTAMLSMPDGINGDAFLVYDNYKNILKWNRSDYFATAVGYLSDRIR